MTDRRQTLNRPRQPDLLAGVVSPAVPPTPPGPPSEDNGFWIDTLRAALAERSGKSKAIAEQALKACPTDPELMLLSALTALASGEPGHAISLVKRFGKRYQTRAPAHLLTALALADQGQYAAAWAILKAKHLDTPQAATAAFIGDAVMHDWLRARLRMIKTLGSQRIRPVTQKRPEPPPPAPKKPPPRIKPPPPAAPALPDLPRLEARFDMTFEIANPDAIEIAGADPDPIPFRLRGELVRLIAVRGIRRTALPARAARRRAALVSDRNRPQSPQAISRPRPAGR